MSKIWASPPLKIEAQDHLFSTFLMTSKLNGNFNGYGGNGIGPLRRSKISLTCFQ